MRLDNFKKTEAWFFSCGKLTILFLALGGEPICDTPTTHEPMEIRQITAY